MRTSILGSFFLASPVELQEGANWYRNANDICRKLGSQYDLPTATIAAVIAALSPQNPWERNVQDAANLIEAYMVDGKTTAQTIKVGTFGKNRDKVIAILELGFNITSYEIHRILNGLKVRNFYECMMLDANCVCVDGHAYSIWLGERVSTFDTPKITPKLYDKIADDYRICTAKINSILGASYTPAQIQAITWVVHRNMYAGQRKRRAK